MDELTRQIIKTEINANDIVRIKSVNFIAKKNTDRIKLDALNHLSQSNYLVLSSHIPIENSIVSNISLWFFWGVSHRPKKIDCAYKGIITIPLSDSL